MRHPALRSVVSVVAVFTVFAVTTGQGAGDDDRTGTRLESRTARPSVMYLNRPNANDEIIQLIRSGRNDAAVALARKQVDRLRSTQLVNESLEPNALYFALNALCVALMTTSEIDEALDTCSEAIANTPRQWSAWNSRGTVHFANFSFDAALADFQRALALAPRDPDIVETIQLNIRLANERLRGN